MKKINQIKNHRIQKALRLITFSIVEFLISQDGVTVIDEIEKFTELKKISPEFVAAILKMMKEEGLIDKLNTESITASVARLKNYLKQNQIQLPERHAKPWSDDEYVKLAEMSMRGVHVHSIAKDMKRTERSISMQACLVKKAYKLIPLIEKYESIKLFVQEDVIKEN